MIRGLVSILLLLPQLALAKQLISLEEALKAAFPDCETKNETHYLTPEQQRTASEQAGSKLASAVVIRYAATCAKKPGGYAYTDTHRVRTHPETLMIAVDPQSQISRIEVLSFDEPTDYLPRGEWYGKFKGQTLGPELALKKAIPPVTGSSLTSRSTAEAARRALALHQILSKSDVK